MSLTGRRSSVLSSPLTLDDWLDRCPNDEPDSMIYDNDYVSEVASMKVKQKMLEIESFYKFIIDIYAKMGMPPQMLEGSLNYMDDHLSRCMLEAQEFEQSMFDKLCERKQDLLDQIAKMLKDLCLPPYIPDDNVTLLQDAKKLKTKFNELNELKQKRITRLQLLRNKQIKLCSTLGIEPPKVDMKTDIPSDEELNKLSNAILDLEKEEQRRKEKYHLMRDMINKCMEHLEYEPRDDSERELLNAEPCLTDTHLNKMSTLHSKLEAMYAKNDELHKKLQTKLIALYDRLDVEKDERDAFLEAHLMCKPSVLAEIEVEIERYEELKKQNIGLFIEKIKEELVLEYERCFVSQEEQDNFLSLRASVSGECNEELLELCERELERIKTYYNENKEILDKFQKWRQMWKELIELEVKANDPNRFNNRGGQLLLEEKKRKALQKGLPKIEKELAALNGKPADQNQPSKIKVFGTDMDEFITGCWDELNNAKEEEKKERQRAKMNEGNSGCRMKKVPQPNVAIKRTPSKRAPGAGITPTPNKLRCQRSVLCTPSNNTFRTNPQATSGSVKKSAKNLFQPSMIAKSRQLTAEKSGIPVSDSNSRADKKDKPTNNSNGSDFGSALSLSEQEFEEIIVSCPASARRRR